MSYYKFRSLQNIEYVLDIILNERLYCASYDDLNDPFEGLFYSYSIVGGLRLPLPIPPIFDSKKVGKYRSISDLHEFIEHSRICSLSNTMEEVRLWSLYADSHKGIAIEIDFSNNLNDIHRVTYDDKLPEFGSTVMTQPTPIDVLTRKTYHWDYEKEYRIIQASPEYPIPGRIKAIYAGHRISEMNLCLLRKVVPEHIPVIQTEINPEEVVIQPIKEL